MVSQTGLRHLRLLAARAAAAFPASPHQRPSRSPFSAPSRAQTQMSSSSSSWAVLGSIPRVAAPAEGVADVSLALAAPPRVSILTVSPRVFPEPVTPQHFPFVLAADPSGLLLLQASLGHPWTREATDGPGVHWHDRVPRYFVLDANAASAFRLSEHKPDDILHQALLGLIASPGGGGHYMVSELRPIMGTDKATLLSFSSEAGRWIEKRVRYPLPRRVFAPVGVVSHHGRLWWVDLTWGVITSDPFADSPVLGFVQFPPDRVLRPRQAWGECDRYRCVGVSGGKLRFVDTYYMGGTPSISVWTLPAPDSTEWTLEHEVSFGEIWADESYKATGLPVEIPRLALIHPENPDVVYFFLQNQLFGVDVRACKVVECVVYDLVAPPSSVVASRFVRAWRLPQPLPSGMLNWSNDPILSANDKAPPGSYPLEGVTRQTFIG